MPRLIMRLVKTFYRPDLDRDDENFYHTSLIFHRWLPNGESDALAYALPSNAGEIRVWFERCGFMDDSGCIQYDPKRREVDPQSVSRHDTLASGPMHAEAILDDVPNEQVNALLEQKQDSEAYIALGRRIVKKDVIPHLARFVRILKFNYGHYWLDEIEEWDSRHVSLGEYCRQFQLRARLEVSSDWQNFCPTPVPEWKITVRRVIGYFPEDFLSEKDWKDIGDAFCTGYHPSSEARLLNQAHEFNDQGQIRFALIAAVTCLEVAMATLLRRKHGSNSQLKKALQSFYSLSISAQLTTIALTSTDLDSQVIEDAIRAVDVRHGLVHEGKETPSEAPQLIHALNRVSAALLSKIEGPGFKFPPRLGLWKQMPHPAGAYEDPC